MKGTPRPSWWTSDDWSTPQYIVDRWAAAVGPFDLDPCCRPETAKAPKFYTIEDDGLVQLWFGLVWVNPPYSQPKRWVEKAVAETARDPTIGVVMLLPAAIDTHWFHDLVVPHARVVFVRGRIRFLGWEGTPIGSPTAGNIFALFPKAQWEDGGMGTFDARPDVAGEVVVNPAIVGERT